MRHCVSIAILVLLFIGGLTAPHVMAQDSGLTDLLPAAEEVGPDFAIVDDRPRSLEEQATGFSDATAAASQLATWQWQANAFQAFAADARGETVEISLTRFANAESAATALDYFLDDRVALLAQRQVEDLTPLGDEARAIDGFINGGYDYTLYARSGPLLIRISALSATGSPTVSPQRIAQGIIDRFRAQAQPADTSQPIAAYLPDTVPLAACAWSDADAKLDLPSFIERFDGVPDAAATLAAMGWQEGVYRQFGCDDPPPGAVGWVNMSVQRYADTPAAAEAVPFFAAARAAVTSLQDAPAPAIGDRAAALSGPAVNGTEYTLYVSQGPLLFRVTGVAPEGDPRADVEMIASALLTQDPSSPTAASPTPIPTVAAIIAPTPTIAPVAAATALPTRAPIPTALPLPTATSAPPTAIPTATAILTPRATAIPTETPVPTLIPVTVPTAAVGGAAGPQPTPTPRVIHPPTQTGE
jgi:hypothetical protein